MGQVSSKLRKVVGGYSHWCPGCGEMHMIGTDMPCTVQWSFDGNLTAPTFKPSVRHTGKRKVLVDGKWTGEWVRNIKGKAVDHCCHYHLEAGILKFCTDSTHFLVGQSVPLPDLPAWLQDDPTDTRAK
jgi:hypothetical protein